MFLMEGVVMGKSDPIILDGVEYNKTKAAAEIKRILNDHPIGHYLEESEFRKVKDLLNYHLEKETKIGVGIESLQIVREEMWGGRRFDIVRTDGSREDFSYIKCLNSKNLQHKDALGAFRFEIAHQIIDFKKKAYGRKEYVRCGHTNLNVRQCDCHIDHVAPLTFEQLVFDFLKARNLAIPDVKTVSKGVYEELKDDGLSSEWKRYHAENARLQVSLDHANLGQKKVKIDWDELL